MHQVEREDRTFQNLEQLVYSLLDEMGKGRSRGGQGRGWREWEEHYEEGEVVGTQSDARGTRTGTSDELYARMGRDMVRLSRGNALP